MYKIKKMDLLISIYIFCVMISEFMGAKTFPLFSIGSLKINSSVAILVFPLIYATNDIVTEVFGKVRARSIIRSSLIIIFLIFLFSLLATYLPPSARFSASEKAYDEIFTKSARLSAASLVALAIGDFLDVLIFSKIRQKFGRKNLWFRTNLSNFIAQLSDTTIFMTLAFYALPVNFKDNGIFLIGLILPYWLIKCSMSVIETPIVYLGVNWLKKENTNESLSD